MVIYYGIVCSSTTDEVYCLENTDTHRKLIAEESEFLPPEVLEDDLEIIKMTADHFWKKFDADHVLKNWSKQELQAIIDGE